MKFNIKSAILGCVVGVMVSSGVSVFAYNGTKNISATFKNIKIYVDGSELTPRDSNGNVLEPFIYNGSTYLPVRAVGEAVGKNVSYDSNNNSVYIGNDVESKSLVGTQLDPYQIETGDIEDVKMGGKVYRNAVSLMTYEGSQRAYYNLNGQYTSISGLYGYEDGDRSSSQATICFYGDGKLIKEITVYGGQLPKNFNLNVTGVSQFVIETQYIQEYSHVCFGDVIFK
jgi:hypothetical protein